MPNLSNRRTPIAAALIAAAIVAPSLGALPALAQPPQIPATFFGTVTVDGKSVPPGTPIRALIDGVDCTQPGGGGAFEDAGASHYLVDVMHETQAPGCGRTGVTVSFLVGDRTAEATATWNSGPANLDLRVGTAPPPGSPITDPGTTASQSVSRRDWVIRGAVAGIALVVVAGIALVFVRKAREKQRV